MKWSVIARQQDRQQSAARISSSRVTPGSDMRLTKLDSKKYRRGGSDRLMRKYGHLIFVVPGIIFFSCCNDRASAFCLCHKFDGLDRSRNPIFLYWHPKFCRSSWLLAILPCSAEQSENFFLHPDFSAHNRIVHRCFAQFETKVHGVLSSCFVFASDHIPCIYRVHLDIDAQSKHWLCKSRFKSVGPWIYG